MIRVALRYHPAAHGLHPYSLNFHEELSMRVSLPALALAAALASPSFAGDTQAGTTVTWGLSSELTGQTGTKQYG